jgi:uncharacterized protein YdaU (DUF1376 family)
MKRPWMPLYVGDYLADTAHLSAAESGAYLHLIMHYWVNGALPQDDAQLRRISRMTLRQWSQSRDLLRSKFGDHWRHQRIEHELAQAIEISNKRSASAVQMHSKRSASAHANGHTLTLTHTKKEENGIRQESKEAKSSITTGFPAYPDSEEFKKWKAWAFERNIPLWRELQKREMENRPFDFETQWPN